ncbi:HAMP domain-containing sensor histidine kinase [Amycolatopsis sp.]|uniref:HAMP domain-containing sensor histidine kinase n=1 Tax=Amycolatopsis sp. TaxID=37632 RepID=UPI002D80DFFC|nr:HAMP domain-containing sensor histidine kinase [Amycolatopsis sp.]HET6707784.1 HAMP domain-containing sensor histidine kinase [Amycolatopsis sp.]
MSGRESLNRRLVVSYVLLVAIAIAAFTVPVAFVLTGQLRGDVETSVRREADTAALLLSAGDLPSRQALARLAEAYGKETPGRLDAVLADGTAPGPLPVPPAADDPAFRDALAGRVTTRWTHAAALDADGLVLAVPARDAAGRVVGAIRVSYPSAPLDARQLQIWGFRAVLAVAVLVVAAFLGAFFARYLTRPFRELNRMAGRLRDGELTARAEETGPDETRTLARTLNNAAETIDTLVRAQRAFIADASHQLRTPLTALRLSLDNIADGVHDPDVNEDVDQATAEVVRMSRLVNGLLTLAKAEAAIAAPEPVRVADVVAGRVAVWRAVAADRGVELRQADADADLLAMASPGHLEQVLDNVLSNALEVSPDGGAVTVSSGRREGHAVLEIADQGPGMPEAERSRAFDRFWRGQGRTGPSGSGLGLAIVKQLVTDDGGTVSLGDADGGGLAVRIALPLGHR